MQKIDGGCEIIFLAAAFNSTRTGRVLVIKNANIACIAPRSSSNNSSKRVISRISGTTPDAELTALDELTAFSVFDAFRHTYLDKVSSSRSRKIGLLR